MTSVYGTFKSLPIGTDFTNVSSLGLGSLLDSVESTKNDSSGRMSSAAFMRVAEAGLVDERLKRLLGAGLVKPEMAQHIRNLPIDNVFAVSKMFISYFMED